MAQLSGLPALVAPGPPSNNGAQGAKGHRPSEKKVESKDIVKAFGESLSFQKRLNLPRGMLHGGGSCDYVARWSSVLNKIKALAWAGAPLLNDSSSLVMRGTSLLGPLASASASADAAAAPGFTNLQSGAPVNIQAIQRSMGAFSFRQEALVLYLNSNAAPQTVTFTASAGIPSGPSVTLALAIPINVNAGGSTAALYPSTGYARVALTTSIAPSLVAAGNGLSPALFITQELVVYIFPTSFSGGGVPQFLPSVLTTCQSGGLAAAASDKTVFLNLYASQSIASTTAAPFQTISLLNSRGTTLSGHDGISFDSYQ